MSKTNAGMIERKNQAVARGVGLAHPLFIDSAKNATLTDVEGRKFIDFAGGIAVLNTGHLHDTVKQAVAEQLEKLSHTCFMVMGYEPYVAVCEKINALATGPSAKKSALFTTGAEAVENALKVARAHTGRTGVIAFGAGYHGRTLATLALTGKIAPYSSGMGLMPGDVYRALYPCEMHGISTEEAIASIERIFKFDAEACNIAAIILEPVQGEGGFYVAPKAFMAALREICDKHGILLIADEVQTGAGRTGTFFAMEQMGVEPDITTFAKSIAGGFPLSGIVGKADIMDSIAPGGLGGTYGGSPTACAAALGVLQVFEEEQLLDRAKVVGTTLRDYLTNLSQQHKVIADVRGLGAMIAIELIDEQGQPQPELTAKVVAKARDKGLILISCGLYGNVVRILVPLTVPDAQLQQGLDIISECFAELA
ncbi:4-aminobutyrate--2-oxoglutarate transaminase [Nitrincola iocasae]|uniref:4-aminobutyrate--2-oxoglutarate transaminase n=1 Tax=Nitrincola iocasae TaxID=2614693 RepID=A0A5J6LCM2_9GAMM|nr:4-aminobutyrate--2-oxoglutarate transaminase [Nitrincola iocasae]QEW05971.1 4-aminobutyrate--2-oxoglutarate transaminase [Nitrincola iocasae]